MPNDVTRDIKYVDTAATAVFDTPRRLGRIVWSGMASGAVCLISDAAGNKLWGAEAPQAEDYFEFDFLGYISTLTITTLDSGELYYYPPMD